MIDDKQTQLQIIAIPAFKDNYIWLIHDGQQATVIDPGDAEPVIRALNTQRLQLQTILITHHHQDHIGGVDTLLTQYPAVKVYAPKLTRYHFNHTPVAEPDLMAAGTSLSNIYVLDVPGHTLDHIAYYIEYQQQKWLFCGDTLFGAGCGRLFEGSPQQMLASLQKLAALADDTQVFSAHEYTLNNIDFALTLEPENTALIARRQHTLQLRHAQQPSLPSTIALELATNPFLRGDSIEIRKKLLLENAPLLQVFTKIRELKNLY